MAEVFHRFLVYIIKDIKGRALYPGSTRLCNNSGDAVKLRLRYIGPFTRIGLEHYVKYIALHLNNGISVSNLEPESAVFTMKPGECVNVSIEYVIDDKLSEDLDFVRLKLIADGRLSIGGFQFDAVKVS